MSSPFASLIGVLKGMISSVYALCCRRGESAAFVDVNNKFTSRVEDEVIGCKRKLSHTTASRYGRPVVSWSKVGSSFVN